MTEDHSPEMSEQDLITLVALLSKLSVGILPFPVFLQFARLVALSIVEVVPLRIQEGKVQVLLLERSAYDPIWPGQLHTPGSVIRAYDNSFEDALNRVLEDELLGVKTDPPVFVKNHFNKSKRGKECALIYWVEVKEDPKVGQFYDADDLPSNHVSSQDFVPAAVEHFKQNREIGS